MESQIIQAANRHTEPRSIQFMKLTRYNLSGGSCHSLRFMARSAFSAVMSPAQLASENAAVKDGWP